MDNAGCNATILTGPLEANGIPFAWDPYPPEEMPGFRLGYGAVDRPFQILVPPDRLSEAREMLSDRRGSASFIGLPIEMPHEQPVRRRRRRWAILFFLVFVGFDLLVAAILAVLNALGVLH